MDITDEQRQALREAAERRIARLRWLAMVLEHCWPLHPDERTEIAATLRQLIEEAEA